MNKMSKVLYTDLSIEKCKARFNDDINSYAGNDFFGKIYNNDFYVVYIPKGKYRGEYELRANLKSEGNGTRIEYELSSPSMLKKIVIFLLLIPLAGLIIPFIDNDQNFFMNFDIGFYFAISYGFIILLLLPAILISNYYYNRKLIRFVKTMFNLS
jgi:hypothetical protein